MKKTILLIATSFLILSCGEQSPKKESSTNTKQEVSTTDDDSQTVNTNYAVIWKWTTKNAELVSANLPAISKELTKLWKDGVIENVYYDNNSPTDKLENFANVAFFLKAKSRIEAMSILNELTVVKKGIGTYIVNPVGLLWLDRRSDVIKEKGMTNSFVAVWKTEGKADVSVETVQAQSKLVTKLWNEGTIENVYFDIEGIQKENVKTDFVFFVNANTKEEAAGICNSLPFFKENIASYEMYQAGVFWMGKYQN